jgi:NAD(P)H-flavin reductase
VYFPLLPRFPEGGKLTQHMHMYMWKMQVGDTLGFKGPLGEIDFDENLTSAGVSAPRDTLVRFQHKGAFGGDVKHIGFIAGGSGITPCLQVATALLQLERDITVSLLYANQTAEDILYQEEIDNLAKDARFKAWYTVDRPTDGWKFSVGFINEQMCREYLPLPSADTFTFICGPPPMIKFACMPALVDKIGHATEQVLIF